MTATASAETEKAAASETDNPMHPANCATGTAKTVDVVVSVVVLALLPFIFGLYVSVVVIMVMWLVSVVVLPLLPFISGLYMSVVVIMVMWLVAVVVLPLLPFISGLYMSVVVIMVM